MKIFSWIVACAILIAVGFYYYSTEKKIEAGEQLNFSTWKEFTPRSKLFKVSFPNQPQYGKDWIDTPNSDEKRRYDMYASEKVDGTLFLINVMTYPEEVKHNSLDDLLHQTVQELLKQKPEKQLTKFLENPFYNHKSYDFSMENKEYHVEGKAIQDENVVFMLTYITKKDNFDEIEYQHFISSFKILDKKEDLEQTSKS